MHTDWTCPDLRSAAVEFILQQIGKPPPVIPASRWRGSLDPLASALGIKGPMIEDLATWCQDRRFQPTADYSGLSADASPNQRPESKGVADDAALIEKAAASLPAPNVPEGALPAPAPDLLAALLTESAAPVLSREERNELARALERGDSISLQQRNAIAITLRGSTEATQADVVRGVIDFVIPAGSEVRHAWEATQSTITLRAGDILRHEPCSVVISGFPLLGATTLCVIRDGVVIRAIPYARFQRERPAPKGGRLIGYRYLRPVKVFARESVSKKVATLADFVRPAEKGRNGAEWAGLFGETKQATSLRRKELDARIRKLTGARSGMRAPGLRHKPQSNKGTTRKDHTDANPAP